jgi:hypothetical protein
MNDKTRLNEARRQLQVVRAENKRLQKELNATQGHFEQKHANDQVRQMKETGMCPACGSEV